MFKLTKKRVGIGVTAAVMVVGAPLAYSYWTQGGSGEGTAATGETVDITVNQDDFGDELYPGGDFVALQGTFTNPNPGPVHIDHITAEVVDTDDPGCTSADFEISGAGLVEGEIVTGDTWDGLGIKMVNRDMNQDDCKNVVVNIAYTAHALPAPA